MSLILIGGVSLVSATKFGNVGRVETLLAAAQSPKMRGKSARDFKGHVNRRMTRQTIGDPPIEQISTA